MPKQNGELPSVHDPGWLGREWVEYLTRTRSRCKGDDPADAAAVFAEMIRVGGVSPERILVEIRSKSRDRTEHLWQFKARLIGSAKPALRNGAAHRTPEEQMRAVKELIERDQRRVPDVDPAPPGTVPHERPGP